MKYTKDMEEDYKVGDFIIFKRTGGYISGSSDSPLRKHKVYKIEKLNKPYGASGDCNATLNGNVVVRLSEFFKNKFRNNYHEYFRKATPEEIYTSEFEIPVAYLNYDIF